MKQSVLKKIFVVSGVLFVLLTGWTALSIAFRIRDIHTSIIGGADGPTMILLMQTEPACFWMFPVLAVFAGTGIALLVRKIRKR